MNNYLMSFVFLLLILLYYLLVGSLFFLKVKNLKNKFGVYIITGLIVTFSTGWIFGFPCQIYSKSWSFFSKGYSILLILIGVISIIGNVIFRKKCIRKLIDNVHDNPKYLVGLLMDHLKKYWFIYVLVLIFTWFSITNLMPYTKNNYGDDYYIVKMVHNIKIDHLLSEDVTGNALHSYGKFGFAVQSSHHAFNTYEIVYSYFANLFGIGVVTFARFTMTIHNYLIWFLTLQLLGSIFVDEYISQYSVIFFVLLLIPEGYAARGMGLIKIRLFENWRNQTAIYMGGSIVRNTSFPLLLFISSLFYKHKSISIFLLNLLTCVFLISNQTTAISYILLYLPLFIVGFILYLIWDDKKFKDIKFEKKLIYFALSAVVITSLLFLITKGDYLVENINIKNNNIFSKFILNRFSLSNGIDKKNLLKIYTNYLPYYKNVFKLDTFALIAPVSLILSFLFSKDNLSRIIVLIISLMYLTFRINKLKLLLPLISIDFFGSARILHSIILLIIFSTGVNLILIINFALRKIKSNVNQIILCITSCLITIATIGYINCKMSKIIGYHLPGDGITKDGYSSSILLKNDQMIADIFIKAGCYFDSLPNKKYIVYSPEKIKSGKYIYSNQNLLFASRKIALASINWDMYKTSLKYKDEETAAKLQAQNAENWWLNAYLNGKTTSKNWSTAIKFIKEGNVDYAFITQYDQEKKLEKIGWNIVNGSKKNGYWILKRN